MSADRFQGFCSEQKKICADHIYFLYRGCTTEDSRVFLKCELNALTLTNSVWTRPKQKIYAAFSAVLLALVPHGWTQCHLLVHRYVSNVRENVRILQSSSSAGHRKLQGLLKTTGDHSGGWSALVIWWVMQYKSLGNVSCWKPEYTATALAPSDFSPSFLFKLTEWWHICSVTKYLLCSIVTILVLH